MEGTEIFDGLKSILKHYEENLLVVHSKPDNYYLHTPPTDKNKKGEFFGAAQLKKNYVSFHLMPVYCYPDLLATISEDLRKHMQGKSCFNFTKTDSNLFHELQTLTKTCFDRYKSLNKV